MRLTDINSIILGHTELPTAPRFREFPDYTSEIEKALVLCDKLYNPEHLQMTRMPKEFYAANPYMDAVISDWRTGKNDTAIFKKELFYSILCGAYVPTIPTAITAMFILTRRECETPNQMISALDKTRMKPYLTQKSHSNPRFMKDLLDSIWGYKVNLVTENVPMVTNNGVVEIYIQNVDDILLCSPSIRDILTEDSDIKSLWLSTEKGVVLGDTEVPVRTLIQSFGIVKNDLDLRRVFLANES